MATPACSRLVPERAVPLPRIISREQQERMAATRQVAVGQAQKERKDENDKRKG
jgi:hypothetical protein